MSETTKLRSLSLDKPNPYYENAIIRGTYDSVSSSPPKSLPKNRESDRSSLAIMSPASKSKIKLNLSTLDSADAQSSIYHVYSSRKQMLDPSLVPRTRTGSVVDERVKGSKPKTIGFAGFAGLNNGSHNGSLRLESETVKDVETVSVSPRPTATISVCILGDTETGKTTLLSRLKYIRADSNGSCTSIESASSTSPHSAHSAHSTSSTDSQPAVQKQRKSADPPLTYVDVDDRLYQLEFSCNNMSSAHVYIVLYDVTRYETLAKTNDLIEKIKNARRPSLEDTLWFNSGCFPIIIVGNKLDYSQHLGDTITFAKEIVHKQGIADAALISALRGDNIEVLKRKIVLVRKRAEDMIEESIPKMLLRQHSEGDVKKGCKIS